MNDIIWDIYHVAKDHGWWENERPFGELIALCHSELSEALEEYRKGHDFLDVYYTEDAQGRMKPEGIGMELADLLIRVFDLSAHYKIPIMDYIKEKHEYNRGRPYKHGKII
jgi:NTP pyrophosphatase (non-canonical NTP hydrolase)